ncbi:MAG: NAD-dependent epimerase/dehydratase family protein, partial [Acidobacteriaceae bacterium]
MKNGFWRDRAVFVTGATGLVGGWLTKHLLEQGASVTALVRDWVPASEFVQAGLAERVNIVRGGLASPYFLERALGEYEIEVVFHLAAQTIVGI